MKTGNGSKSTSLILLIAALLPLQFAVGQVPVTLTTSGFGPSSSSAAGPRITWTPFTANASGNFTLTGPAGTSTNRYVSFAFANDAHMKDAILVVDCYEFGGVVMLGNSKNAELAGSGVNYVNMPPSNSVLPLNATKQDGLLTCRFSMTFPPTLEVYVLLSNGNLASTANASFPKKTYHGPNGRFYSNFTYGQLLATTAAPTSSSTMTSTSTMASSTNTQLTPSGFGLSSSSSAAAAGPRIAWTTATASAFDMFTLTSAASSDSSNRYVSFAFANGTKMVNTLTIVDCYEIDGRVMLGTSRNVYIAGNRTNVNDPASGTQVILQSATKNGGVLTCNFKMKFTPTLDVYVILAAGFMSPDANASYPTKQYHGMNGHYVSAKTISQVLSSASASPSATTFVYLAAITVRIVCW